MSGNAFSLVAWALALAAALTASHGFMRMAAAHRLGSIDWLLWVAPALAIYVLVFVGYLQLLRVFPLSQLFPIYTALSVLGVFVLGVWRFGEPITLARMAGLALIIAGVALLTR